jgi:hypothetical protein
VIEAFVYGLENIGGGHVVAEADECSFARGM